MLLATDTLLRFLGRLHPSIIHFPVALLLAAALFELLLVLRRRGERSGAAFACVAVAAPAALLAAASGWLNAAFEPQASATRETLELHRWAGVGVAALSCLALLAGALSGDAARTRTRRAWRILLFAGALGAAFTGHLGGSLVWGESYLTAVFRMAPDESAPVEGRVDFATRIEPILRERCWKCHGPEKQKGDVRLDSREAVFGGERDLWVIEPGDASKSLLYQVITLPPDDKKHMPARGPPLEAAQIALIRRWIEQGAHWE